MPGFSISSFRRYQNFRNWTQRNLPRSSNVNKPVRKEQRQNEQQSVLYGRHSIKRKSKPGRTDLPGASISVRTASLSTHSQIVGSVNVSANRKNGKQPRPRKSQRGSVAKMSGSVSDTATTLYSVSAPSAQMNRLQA